MLLVSLIAALSLGAGLTVPQERGREIFVAGRADDAPIMATLGGGAPVDAVLVPCANCHGADGRGKTEGGVRAVDISAGALAAEANLPERRRMAYTQTLLKRAITMGYDASGHTLDRAMPRFELSQQDAADLLAYLTILGAEQPLGVSDDAIQINVLGAPGFVATDTRIYGRRVVIQHERTADALLTIDASTDPSTSVQIAAREHIPTIVVHSGPTPPGPYAFVLTATADDQVSALRAEALRASADAVLLTNNCVMDHGSMTPRLVLMTSDAAANCDVATLAVTRDRRILVAAAVPPEIQNADAGAGSALWLVTGVLSGLGRDVSRGAFVAALEHVYRAKLPGLPPITWNANRHVGTHDVLLMTLDVRTRRLISEPGWVGDIQ